MNRSRLQLLSMAAAIAHMGVGLPIRRVKPSRYRKAKAVQYYNPNHAYPVDTYSTFL